MTQKSSTDIQAQIDKVTAEKANYIGSLEKELKTAQEQRFTEAYQQKLQADIDRGTATYEGLLDRLEDELSKAREIEIRAAAEKQAEQERTAAETKELIKAELKARWIEAHGDLDVFEAQFPKLYAEEMAKRASGKLSKGEVRGQTSVITNAF